MENKENVGKMKENQWKKQGKVRNMKENQWKTIKSEEKRKTNDKQKNEEKQWTSKENGGKPLKMQEKQWKTQKIKEKQWTSKENERQLMENTRKSEPKQNPAKQIPNLNKTNPIQQVSAAFFYIKQYKGTFCCLNNMCFLFLVVIFICAHANQKAEVEQLMKDVTSEAMEAGRSKLFFLS